MLSEYHKLDNDYRRFRFIISSMSKKIINPCTLKFQGRFYVRDFILFIYYFLLPFLIGP